MASNWKEIQQRTFTNWFNDRLRGNLKVSKRRVDDLETDLADGLNLIALLEILAQARKVERWNRNPRNKLQCIENLGAALRFIYSENIKLVNIGPEDINGCNLKLILGLVWTLIRHYQIRSTGRGLSTKQAMKQWLDTLIPEYKVENFTTDWNNGMALCGLVDHLEPGLCPNHLALDPRNGLENCQLGMDLAERHLEIPKVLDPADLNNPDVDELSVMTYVSYFFNPAQCQLLRWINEKIPQRKVTNFSTDWNDGISLAALMDACHPGLFPEWRELDPQNALENLTSGIARSEDQLQISCPVKAQELSNPKVDEIVVATYLSRFKHSKLLSKANNIRLRCPSFADGTAIVNNPIKLDVDLGSESHIVLPKMSLTVARDGSEEEEPLAINQDSKGHCSAEFTPKVPGTYTLSCRYHGDEVVGSPLNIPVVNPRDWKITTPIPKFLQVGKETRLMVSGNPIESSPQCLLSVTDDIGNPSQILDASFQPNDSNASANALVLTPKEVGKATVGMRIAGVDIAESPFGVSVCDASACLVTGLDEEEVEVGEPVEFEIDANGAGSEQPQVEAQGPTTQYKVAMKEESEGVFVASFTPKEEGPHSIPVTYGGENVPRSPFSVLVTSARQFKIVSAVPRFLQVGVPTEVTFSGGNRLSQISCVATANGGEVSPIVSCALKPMEEEQEMYCLTLMASAVGQAEICIKVGKHEVQKSPFDVTVCDATQCIVSGLNSNNYQVGVPVKFTLRTSGAGLDSPVVKPTGPTVHYQPHVADQGEDEHLVTFIPREAGLHQIPVTYGDADVPGSPFTIDVLDLKQHKILGDIPEFLQIGQLKNIQVSTGSSLSNVTCAAVGLDGQPSDAVTCSLEATKDPSISDLCLSPAIVGKATISVKIGDHHFQRSPFDVVVCDSSKCCVSDLDLGKSLVGEPVKFHLDTTGAGEDVPVVKAMGPTAQYKAEAKKEEEEGKYAVSFTPWEAGMTSISILFGGTDIPGSPFQKVVESVTDTSMCSATGSGLVGAVATVPAHFTVTAFNEGLSWRESSETSPLEVTVQDESHTASVSIEEKSQGIYTVTYIAPEEGDYDIKISLCGTDIPGSPFAVHVFPKPDPSKCRAYGPALHPNAVLVAGRSLDFSVDTRNAGTGELQIVAQGPKQTVAKVFAFEDNRRHTVKVETGLPGWYKIDVLWSQVHIPKSPFKLPVHSQPDASKVRAFGVGLGSEIEVGRPAEFTIVTRNAGMGTLIVVVKGVKDAFKVEVNPRDECDPRTLEGEYNPTEAGDYSVTIRWSGTDIPGSPFPVRVIDPAKELAAAEAKMNREAQRAKRLKQTKLRSQAMLVHPGAVPGAVPGQPLQFYPGIVQRGGGGEMRGQLMPIGGGMVATQHSRRVVHTEKVVGRSRHTSEPATSAKHLRRPKKLPRLKSSSAVEAKMQSNAAKLASTGHGAFSPGYVGDHDAVTRMPQSRRAAAMRASPFSDTDLRIEQPVKYNPIYVATGHIPDEPLDTKSKKKKKKKP